MKTIEIIKAMYTDNREAYRNTIKTYQDAMTALEQVYRDTIDMRPADTVSAYVAAVGYDTAVSTIATLINCNSRDDRISPRSIEWAQQCDEAWDAEAAHGLCMYSDRIHKSHLEQLAEAMIAYVPTEPTEPTIAVINVRTTIVDYHRAVMLIYQQGATREKSILQNPHNVTYGDTWNNDHKIIDIFDAFDKNNSCSVDLITNTICG